MTTFGIILLILAGITLLASRRFTALAWIAAIMGGFAFYALDWPFGWIGIVAGVVALLYLFVNDEGSELIARFGIVLMIVFALVVGPNWDNPFDDEGNDTDKAEFTFNPSEISCRGDYENALERERAKVKDAVEDDTITVKTSTKLYGEIHDRLEECKKAADSTPKPKDCADSWTISRVGAGSNNRWMDGLQAIREAETDEQARKAAEVWVNQIKHFANQLSGAAAYFNIDEDVDFDALIDDGCASEEAVKLIAELELALADARITPDEAPADGYNSGVNAEGDVVTAGHAGITGDRKAIKVVLKDGTTVWIMARCGNPVVVDKPRIPEGPTDQPPPQNPPPETPPTTVPCPPNHHDDVTTPERDCIHNSVEGNPDPQGTEVRQDPQEVDLVEGDAADEPTPGAPEEPSVPPEGPEPEDGTAAPEDDPGGFDSGDDDGSETPNGSDCNTTADACEGGGPEPPEDGDPPEVDDDTHSGDPGEF